MAKEELEFGFVPHHIVNDLQDIGNWKSRANAIDNLHKSLRDVYDRSQIMPELSKFVSFLVQLVSDPNFKIAVSSMQILGDLVGKVGKDIEPQLKTIIPTLMEKFSDSKVLVRSANLKVLKKLMLATSAHKVLELLEAGMTHTNWRVREEVVNTIIMAVLQHGDSLDHTRTFKMLASALSDSKDQVQAVALEAIAVLNKVVGPSEMQSMMRTLLTDAQRAQVAARLANPQLPAVNLDGIVEHVGAGAASPHDSWEGVPGESKGHGRPRPGGFAGATAASGAGARLPWELPSQRPRLRSGQDSLGVIDPVPDYAQPLARSSYATQGGSRPNIPAAVGPPSLLAVPSPTPGGGHMRPGGSYSRHMNHHQSQPKSENSWSSGFPMSPGIASLTSLAAGRASKNAVGQAMNGSVFETSYSASSEAVSAGGAVSTETSASSRLRSDVPSATPGQGSINLNGLAALKQQRELASRSIELPTGSTAAGSQFLGFGRTGSSVEQNMDGDSSGFNSPLTPSRGFKPLMPPASDRLQSSISTTHQASSGLSGDSGQEVGQGRSNLNRVSGQPNGHNPPAMNLWLQTSLESESQARAETFSPSKVELLANLKRRQIEKRANSAQLPLRPSDESVVDSPVWSGMRKDPPGFDGVNPSSQYGPGSAVAKRSMFSAARDEQTSGNVPKPPSMSSINSGGILGSQRNLPHSFSGGHGSQAAMGIAAAASTFTAFTEDAPLSAHRAAQPTRTSAGNSCQPANGGLLGSRLGRLNPAPFQMDLGPDAAGTNPATLASPSTSLAAALARLTPNLGERLRARSADINNPAASGTASIPASALSSFSSSVPPVIPRAGTFTLGGGGGGASNGPSTPSRACAPPGSAGYWDKSIKPLEEVPASELTPVPEPERTIRTVIAKLLESNNADRKELDWQGQYEALNDARRLVKHHPEVIRAALHEFVRVAVPSVDQLRSFCVKNAITLFQEMFVGLGKALDRELEEVVPTLIKKAGEISNAGRETFLATEADRALCEMWRNCTETRSIAALCASAGHKSGHVRSKVASHLDCLLEAAGPSLRTSLGASSSLLEKLFRTAAGFLNEGGLETRTYGKRIIWHMKSFLGSAEFDRLRALVNVEALSKKVTDVVEGLNGPPPPPSRGLTGSRGVSRQLSGADTRFASASPGGGVLSGRALQDAQDEGVAGWRAGNKGPGNSFQSASAPSGSGDGTSYAGGPARVGNATPERRKMKQLPSWRTRIATAGGDDAAAGAGGGGGSYAAQHAAMASRQASFTPASADALNKMLGNMTSKDFRERLEGLKAVQEMASSGQLNGTPEGLMVQLLDGMTARLSDGNAKVAVAACEVLVTLFSCLNERVAPGLNTLVPALAAAMGSANDKVRVVAATAADALLASVDPSLLVQNFAHCVSNGHLRGKPLLVERLQAIAVALWPSKPQLAVKHVVPATFSLLQDTKGEGKAAAQALLTTLAQLMGDSLLEHTGMLQPAAKQRVVDAVSAAGNSRYN